MSTKKLPAYKQVYGVLKKHIRDGDYLPGTLLPTELMLENEFNVSRTTIRNAIALLSAEGYIHVKQGHGTEVLDVSTTQKLNCITSVTETLRQKGYEVTTHGMYIVKETAPDYVYAKLELDKNIPFFRIQRVQYADGQPFAIMTNYIRCSVAPDLDRHVGSFVSLYGFLEERYHVQYKEATEYITAIGASFEESQILKVPVDSPLLHSKRIVRDVNGPFEYGDTRIKPDKYEYCIHMQDRNKNGGGNHQ